MRILKLVGKLFNGVFSLLVLLLALIAALLYFRREEIFSIISEATGQRASLRVLAGTDIGLIEKPWAHLAQGGEDPRENMLAPVKDEVVRLSPQTIRLDHIYDGYDVVGRLPSGQLTFNWLRLDEVVNTILEMGAVPMLSLSYMPGEISSGDVVDAPRNWDEWALLVQRTIEHYSKDLAIAGVAYEVWNEPDLFGRWRIVGKKNYLTLYHYAALGAARVKGSQSFELGGPATTRAYHNWIDRLLEYVSENNLRMDFLSWHRYSKEASDYVDDVLLVERVRVKYPELVGLKLYITEAGPNSEMEEAYDNTSGAAGVIAIARAVSGLVDRLYSFEIVDGKDPEGKIYWGRWGLITHPSTGMVIKPRFRALEWLNKLNGFQVEVRGEGTWVKAMASRSSQGVLRVLVVNYDPYGAHTETVPLFIDEVKPGLYTLKESLLNGGVSQNQVGVTDPGFVNVVLDLPANGVMLVELLPE